MPRYDEDGRDRQRRQDPSYHSTAHSGRRRSRSRSGSRNRGNRDYGRNRRNSPSPRRSSYKSDEASRQRRDESRPRRRSYSPGQRKDSKDRRRDPHYDDVPTKRRRNSSRSRSPRRDQQPRDPSSYSKRPNAPLPSQQDAFKTGGDVAKVSPPPEMVKPNFSNTDKLAAESKTVTVSGGNSVVLKYHEPPEARKPPAKEAWRLYVFKGKDLLETVELGERSCWLIGRERMVVDFPIDHPSCSKQHAVIQFRYVKKKNEFGETEGSVRPYVIDLGSSNGTHVNGDDMPKERYVELMDKDVLKFGLSTREYVLMLPPPG